VILEGLLLILKALADWGYNLIITHMEEDYGRVNLNLRTSKLVDC